MSSGSRTQARIDKLNAQSKVKLHVNPQKALSLAEEASRVADGLGYQEGMAAAELNAGWALIHLGSYDDAIPHLYVSRDIALRVSSDRGIVDALNALGVVDVRMGETDLAGELFRQALALARSNDYGGGCVDSLSGLAEVSMESGNHRDAREHLREAMSTAENTGLDAPIPAIGVKTGRVLRELGDWKEADDCIERALKKARAAGDRLLEAEALLELGRLNWRDDGEIETGREASAERLLQKSVTICKELDLPEGVVQAAGELGALYVETGRPEEAQSWLEEALAMGERIDSPPACLPAYSRLAAFYEKSGDTARALKIQKEVITIQRRMLGLDSSRRIQALRAQHELDRARSDAELFRLRNVELSERSQELSESYRQLQLMNTIGQELTSSLDMDEITNRVHARLNELMDASVFGIAVYEKEAELLDYALVIEKGQRITPFTQSIHSPNSFGGWVVRNRSLVWLNNAENGYREYLSSRKPFTHRNARSLVFIPLEVEKRIVGVLTVQSFRKNAYTKEHVKMLELLSSYIAVALDNSRQHSTIQELNAEILREKRELELAYERIEHMANHDNLTQLPNRRLLVELITEYLPLAQRQNRRFGLLYIDLDDFKPVNDTLGHSAGDNALITVAERLRTLVRSSDTVARLGGDEFVVVVREVNDEGIQTIAEKVLATISEPVNVNGREFQLSASIGISVFPTHGATYDELLAAADRAMYQVKETGKKGIAFARGGYGSLTTT